MEKTELKQLVIGLFVLAALLIFAGIGMRDPWPPDEPRFALMAKEMWETGQWFFPHRGGEIYPDKPPLVMWMMLWGYALTGNLKLAFLLPSALLSMLTLWMTYDLSRRLWDKKVALHAGVLLICTLQFVLQARSGQLDAPLAFWVMLGCYGLLRHLISGPQWGWYYLAWFAMGLGVITKGVGFLPALMLLILFKYPPQWLPKDHKQWLKWLAGPLFLLLAVSLWLLPMLYLVDSHPNADLLAYRDNILLKQTVQRYGESWAHIKPFWYFFVSAIPWFWFPLSLILLWSFKPLKQAVVQRERRILYPLIWVLICIVFFSFSKGKRAEYMLPMIPMLVVALAPFVHKVFSSPVFSRVLMTVLIVLSLLFLTLGLAGVLEVEKVTRLTAKYEVHPWKWFMITGLLGVTCCWFLRKQTLLMMMGFFSILWISYGWWMAPLADKAFSTKTMMSEIIENLPEDSQLGIIGFREKLLLHSPQNTVHFGYHTEDLDQERAALAWVKGAPNRYLLVNFRHLSECFNHSSDMPYSSFHNVKWKLYAAESLSTKACSLTVKDYKFFQAKTKND